MNLRVSQEETREVPQEFSLGQLLSRRHRLKAEEIPLLLAELPGLLDRLDDSGAIVSLLSDVLVVFAAKSRPLEELMARRVEAWPAFRLKLRVTEHANTAARTSPVGRHLPARLAGLIYELLGGQIRTGPRGGIHYTPVAALGEEGNLTLEEMLTGNAYFDCDSVWQRWLRKSGVRLRDHPISQLFIPKWAVRFGHAGILMELVPRRRTQPAVRFVARDEFRIGRSLRTADLPLNLRGARTDDDPGSPLGGNHLIARVTEAGIALWDGDGTAASPTGSAYGEVRLEARRGLLLRQAAEITLAPGACDCRLRVEPFSLPAGSPPGIANLQDWRSAPKPPERRRPAPFAAMVFHAAGDAVPLRQVAWLFSGIGLRMTKGGLLEWAGDSSADFFCLHARGCFWLACLKEPAERLSVDDAVLAPGQIMPLDAQTLDFGREQFTCRVLGV